MSVTSELFTVILSHIPLNHVTVQYVIISLNNLLGICSYMIIYDLDFADDSSPIESKHYRAMRNTSDAKNLSCISRRNKPTSI